jgi:hypothetical protein
MGETCQNRRPKTKYVILANHRAGRMSVIKPTTPRAYARIRYIKRNSARLRTTLNAYETDGFLHKKMLSDYQRSSHGLSFHILFESFHPINEFTQYLQTQRFDFILLGPLHRTTRRGAVFGGRRFDGDHARCVVQLFHFPLDLADPALVVNSKSLPGVEEAKGRGRS